MTTRLRAALGIGVLGALLLAIGPLLPVVSPATPAGYHSGVVLFVFGLLPTAVAVLLALRGSPTAAGAALLAAALFAPGRLLADVQLAVDGSLATRPELVVPTSLAPLHAAGGLYLMLAGHVLILVAGLLALGQGVERAGSAARPGAHQGPLLAALAAGGAAAIGLLTSPVGSDNAFLLARDVLDAPVPALLGGLLIALAVPLAATIAFTSGDAATARGWLFGSAAVVLAVAVPPLAAGLAVPGLHPARGPYLEVIAALALAALGLAAGRLLPAVTSPDERADGEVRLPRQANLHAAAGTLGLLSGLAAIFGATTGLFVLPAGLPHPDSYSGRQLIPAAVLIAVLGAALLVPRFAAAVRPAFVVGWAAVLLAGAGALDAAFSATDIAGVGIGAGTWFTGLAMLAAVAAAIVAALAGGVERDDVDLSELRARPAVLAPAVLAMLLAVAAFGLPVLRATDYVAPGLWSNFRIASWGLLLGLLAVLGAAALAVRSRPVRAVALLLGAAAVVAVRWLELPLTRGRAADASAGSGAWLSLACFVVLVLAAVAAVWAGRREGSETVG